jgi:aspartate/methionine/tyrosine aminotransferase
MDFETVEYIDWFRINWHDIKFDLATSGLHAVTQKDLGVKMDDLNFGKTLFYGDPKLVELISEIYAIDEKEILVTTGSTHANFLLCTLLLKEGDEVIIEDPVYTPLLDLVAAFNCKIKRIKRRFEEGYKLNPERLNELVGKDTKMIIFTNLHNPSGTMTDLGTLKAISDIAADNKIHVLSDEVYRDFMMEDGPPPFSSLSESGISVCSLSKFYGGGALRVGWAMCDPDIAVQTRKLNDYVTAVNSCAGEGFGALILEHRKWFVEKIKGITERNYPIVKNWIKEREDLEWVEPKYGVIGFPRLKNQSDSMKLAEHLLTGYRTLISPGRFFGPEDHFRLGFGGDGKMLEKGLENLGLALDEMQGQ